MSAATIKDFGFGTQIRKSPFFDATVRWGATDFSAEKSVAPHLTVASKNGDFRIWVPNPKSLIVAADIFFPLITAGRRVQLWRFRAAFVRCVQQIWLLHADTFGPKTTEWPVRDVFLLPRWVFDHGARASGICRRRIGTDNNPFRGLGRIAMAIRRILLLVSHE